MVSDELSIFIDESGAQLGHSKYCIVALVFHEQVNDISNTIQTYENKLRYSGLPNFPFHTSPLMNGKSPYESIDLSARKRILGYFSTFTRKLPFTFKTFAYQRKEVSTPELFIARFKRDLVTYLTDNLEYFQTFGKVKIYYDDGQKMITEALHSALEYIFSKHVVLYRTSSLTSYRLSQVADYICTLELTNLKFQAEELTQTDAKIFGTNYAMFKKQHLKNIKPKLLDN